MVLDGWSTLNEEENRALILGGLFRRIGNFKPYLFLTSFDHRLIFQKTIYLLQAFGLYLGFTFSWYIRGPYSPLLAHYGYILARTKGKIPLVRFVKAKSEKRFEEFLKFLGSRKNDAEWLEILASIHLLKKLYPNKSKRAILQLVSLKQPYFSIRKCEEAWDHLERYGLI
jgi:uncharacterized protein YwgA